MTENPLLTFIHISDTHLNSDPSFTGSHVNFSSIPRTEAIIDHLNGLPFHVDFVLHTGDVMHDPAESSEYQIAGDMFSKLRYPIYFLSGNHDVAPMLKQVLASPYLAVNGTEKFYYQFELNGVQFVCLDSSIPHTAHGQIDLKQLEWLRSICEADDKRPLVVAVHHHVLPIGVPWFDTMRVENGEIVHEMLLKARHRLRAVLYGHIHQDLHLVRDGIPYFSALSTWFQLRSWHGQEALHLDDVQLPGYNVVTLTERDTFVRCYRIAVE